MNSKKRLCIASRDDHHILCTTDCGCMEMSLKKPFPLFIRCNAFGFDIYRADNEQQYHDHFMRGTDLPTIITELENRKDDK